MIIIIIINVKCGIYQGDCLSLLLFCITLFPLSWLLNRSNLGYYVGKGRKSNNLVSHSFFVDDLKLFASNEKHLNSLLETVATFWDIGMSFGLDKCAKLTITKGEKTSTENLQLLTGDLIQELEN